MDEYMLGAKELNVVERVSLQMFLCLNSGNKK